MIWVCFCMFVCIFGDLRSVGSLGRGSFFIQGWATAAAQPIMEHAYDEEETDSCNSMSPMWTWTSQWQWHKHENHLQIYEASHSMVPGFLGSMGERDFHKNHMTELGSADPMAGPCGGPTKSPMPGDSHRPAATNHSEVWLSLITRDVGNLETLKNWELWWWLCHLPWRWKGCNPPLRYPENKQGPFWGGFQLPPAMLFEAWKATKCCHVWFLSSIYQ